MIVECHESIALEVDDRNQGSINRELVVVDAEAVAVCVRVREESGLQYWIGTGFKVWNRMRRRKCSLGGDITQRL